MVYSDQPDLFFKFFFFLQKALSVLFVVNFKIFDKKAMSYTSIF